MPEADCGCIGTGRRYASCKEVETFQTATVSAQGVPKQPDAEYVAKGVSEGLELDEVNNVDDG